MSRESILQSIREEDLSILKDDSIVGLFNDKKFCKECVATCVIDTGYDFFGATTLSITTFSIAAFSLMTLSIMTFSIMTLSITGLFTTLSITGLFTTLSINDTQLGHSA